MFLHEMPTVGNYTSWEPLAGPASAVAAGDGCLGPSAPAIQWERGEKQLPPSSGATPDHAFKLVLKELHYLLKVKLKALVHVHLWYQHLQVHFYNIL